MKILSTYARLARISFLCAGAFLYSYNNARASSDGVTAYNLALKYTQADGVKQNKEKALKLFFESAKQGYAPAQFFMAGMIIGYYGDFILEDDDEAVDWYKKAANQGYAPAQNGLADMYKKGLGVPQDNTLAFQWYQKAANQGYAPAQTNLADSYKKGLGVPKDENLALQWYQKAAVQGYAPAIMP